MLTRVILNIGVFFVFFVYLFVSEILYSIGTYPCNICSFVCCVLIFRCIFSFLTEKRLTL